MRESFSSLRSNVRQAMSLSRPDRSFQFQRVQISFEIFVLFHEGFFEIKERMKAISESETLRP